MARVLIVAKTRMGDNNICIGGLNIDTNESIRLLDVAGWNQPANAPYNVGQIWELEIYHSAKINPPHVEDVIVTREIYIGQIPNLRDMLLRRVAIWHGTPANLFGGLLIFENSRGYIDKSKAIPSCSTGYWQPETSLILIWNSGKCYYQIRYFVVADNSRYHVTLNIPYVGFAEPIQEIPEETLIRVSLARGGQKLENYKDRCYLQISGWYL